MNELINEELDRIINEHGCYNSRKEGWATLLEELQELQEEFDVIGSLLDEFWYSHCRKDTAKANPHLMDILDRLDYKSECLIKEAVQVSAVIKKIRISETRTCQSSNIVDYFLEGGQKRL
jgi:hypothetical protein